MTPSSSAQSTFQKRIAANPYPGRGLVIGLSADGSAWQQVYWIMGRSSNSRNRKFVAEGATLRTEPHDPAKVEDPSLIIYEAMLELPKKFLLSNGDQTRTLCDGLAGGKTMVKSLALREREPDAPNFTPRITGMLDLSGKSSEIALSILKANKADPGLTDRHYYFPATPSEGIGYALTTYEGDGNPLPTFSGDPLLLPLANSIEQTLDLYWEALNQANRISLAVKEVALDGKSSRIALRNALG